MKKELQAFLLIVSMLFALSIEAQNSAEEIKQVNDVKLKLIGTWNYEKTLLHKKEISNPIDSGRIYTFTKKRVLITQKQNGKKVTRKYNYKLYFSGNSVTLLIGKSNGEQCDTGLFWVIYEIDNNSTQISPCYNDHYQVIFSKGN